MSQVNSPFLIKKLRPREAIERSLGREGNNYLDQLERFLEQIYRRSGGSVDSVDSGMEAASSNEIQIAVLRATKKDDANDDDHVLLAQIAAIDSRLRVLEANIEPVVAHKVVEYDIQPVNLGNILRRLEDLEAQL